MTPGELRFAFMTFVFSVTLGLVISTFEVEPVGLRHAILKFGYTVPALLLTVDMWIHYSTYHDGGRRNYEAKQLFLDTLLLTLMYISLGTLRSSPDASDSAEFKCWPSTTFWISLMFYSALKILRTPRMVINDAAAKRGYSWYSVLHILLLALIVFGWLWQQNMIPVGLPFWSSGIVFTVVTLGYLFAVYYLKYNPLKPIRGAR